jgi:hypothetical protein
MDLSARIFEIAVENKSLSKSKTATVYLPELLVTQASPKTSPKSEA